MFSAPVFSLGDNTLLELYNYSSHIKPQPSNNSKMSHLLIPDIFVWSTGDFGAEQICLKHRTLETRASYNFLPVTVQNIPTSSPVARNHFFLGGGRGRGVFELINKESGDEGCDEKGGGESDSGSLGLSSFSPFISHHLPLVLCPRSYHPTLAHLARLQHPALKVCALH